MSLSSNVITITDHSHKISKISYVDKSLVISKGQKSSPPPKISKKDQVFTITLKAGRHGTSKVASKFNDIAGGHKHKYAPSGGGKGNPKDLNFFFALSVEFKIAKETVTETIYLGQGHYLTTNNWWMMGESVDNEGSKPALKIKRGTITYKFDLTGTHDSFAIHPVYVDTPIKHVFVLMLENHSFDNVLGQSGIKGITAATTKDFNTYNDKPYYVHSPAPYSMEKDPGHNFKNVVKELGGESVVFTKGQPYPKVNNSGFAFEYGKKFDAGDSGKAADIMAGFDTGKQLPVMYELAESFTVCDHWFSSMPGPTWPNRYFIHGASSNGLDDSPTKGQTVEWESVHGFSYPNGSIYEAMSQRKLNWRIYMDKIPSGPIIGNIPQVASLKGINNITSIHNLDGFKKDLKSGYDYHYTFIEPNYGEVTSTYIGGTSQHPLDSMHGGEGLIKTVYEAIRNSPVWDTCMLIITYDEHGGFYDSVEPGPAVPPNDGSSKKLNTHGFKFDQLGVRVPAIIISPWVAAGVDDTSYDHTSVLATLEKMFGMHALTDRDAAAKDFLHLLLPEKRTDTPKKLSDPISIPKKLALSKKAQAEIDQQPLPESGNKIGFLAIMLKTELELASDDEIEQKTIMENFKKINTQGEAKAYILSVMKKMENTKKTISE